MNQVAIKYFILLSVALFSSSCNDLISFASRSQTTQAREIISQAQILPITAQAKIKDITIELEVAATAEQQSLGLMFRDVLPENRGMLFPFNEARIARFWMNNVPVALDMVFIKEGKVIAIANSVPPCTVKPRDCPLYGPDVLVDSVLELRAGRAKELGLNLGDAIAIEYLDNSQQN